MLSKAMASIIVSTLSYREDPAMWDDLLRRDVLQYPLGSPLDQEYSRAYSHQFSYRDISVIALHGGEPVAGLQVTTHVLPSGRQHLDFYGRPILLRRNRHAETEIGSKADRALAEEFCKLRESMQLPAFQYLEQCANGRLSDFAVALLKSGCTASPIFVQIINLRQEEGELWKEVRKSYRSLISWGEKNLAITVYDSQNVDPENIEEFRQLHIAVAGKETRTAQTWKLQYRQIVENQAFLIGGRLNGRLVTAALFLHSPSYCYYGVSASIREMFDKPLSHAILWRSVLEAKRRGCQVYEMGELVDLYPHGHSEKEKNIAFFKRGLGGASMVELMVRDNNLPKSE